MSKKHQILHGIYHFLVGFVFLLKGFDKIREHPFIGGLILLFGVIIWTYFFYQVWKKKEGKTLSLLVHLFEAVALLFIAYIFYIDGAKYLPYVTLLSSLGFFIGAVVMINREHRKRNTVVQDSPDKIEINEINKAEVPGSDENDVTKEGN